MPHGQNQVPGLWLLETPVRSSVPTTPTPVEVKASALTWRWPYGTPGEWVPAEMLARAMSGKALIHFPYPSRISSRPGWFVQEDWRVP